MGSLEDAKAWARANLSPSALESFMERIGERKRTQYLVSVVFEFVPAEPHLADEEAIRNTVGQHVTDLMQARAVEVTVNRREVF